MQITAKLAQLLPEQTGAGKNAEWQKQNIIVETNNQYPKKDMRFYLGDKINNSQLLFGKNFKIGFDIESCECNSRWYTDVKAHRVEVVNSNSGVTSNIITVNDSTGDEQDLLPF